MSTKAKAAGTYVIKDLRVSRAKAHEVRGGDTIGGVVKSIGSASGTANVL